MSESTEHAGMDRSEGLLLPGLDGTNPLGFLAAMGLFRLLSQCARTQNYQVAPTLRWNEYAGSWRPEIVPVGKKTPNELAEIAHKMLQDLIKVGPLSKDSDRSLGDKIDITLDGFHSHVQTALREAAIHEHASAQWLPTLAEERAIIPGKEERAIKPGKDECIKTPLDFTAGQQKFLSMARAIIDETTTDMLLHCLMDEWSYTDVGKSLRWDPIDESRRYALVAIDPTNASKNPIRTSFAANALAFAALPLFPISGGRIAGQVRNGTAFRWPIWNVAIQLDVVMSALVDAVLVGHDTPPSVYLNRRGITAIFEAGIVKPVGYYRNFTPAQRIA